MAETNLLLSLNNFVCNDALLFLLIDSDLRFAQYLFCHLAVQPFQLIPRDNLRQGKQLGCYFLDSANSVLLWGLKKLQEWWARSLTIRCASVRYRAVEFTPWSNAVFKYLWYICCAWVLGCWCWEPSVRVALCPARRQLNPFHSPLCVRQGHSQKLCCVLWFQSLSLHQ